MGSVVSVLATMVHTGQRGVKEADYLALGAIVRTSKGGAPLLLLVTWQWPWPCPSVQTAQAAPTVPAVAGPGHELGPTSGCKCSGSNICIPLPQSPPQQLMLGGDSAGMATWEGAIGFHPQSSGGQFFSVTTSGTGLDQMSAGIRQGFRVSRTNSRKASEGVTET